MYYTKPVEEGVETEVMEVETPPVEAPEEVAPIEEDDEPESDPEATNEHEEAPKGLEEQIMAETAQVPRSTLRSGTTFRDVAAANIDSASFGLCTAEINYLQALQTLQDNELGCVGAGIGGGFDHTSELHVMKYNEAMATPDADKWKIAVKEEIQRMEDNQVWTPVDKDQVPTDATILTSTWAMKKKSNGKFRARLNGRGYEQVPGEHYDPSSLAAPVVSSITIRIVFVLMLMAMWPGYILDVRGAFLKGTFDRGEKLYMHVPQGMEEKYGCKVVLLLLKTIYGLKQAAFRFWLFLLTIVKQLQHQRSKADPCLYYGWTDIGALLLWMSWVDDCFITGPETELLKLKREIMDAVDCDDGGELSEYVGCNIDHNKLRRTLKFTQPVLLQSFKNEFETAGSEMPNTPGTPLKALQLGDQPPVEGKRRTYYRSGVGKLMHLKRWSRPEMNNAVRDLSRYNSNGSEEHIQAIHRAMCYALSTPERGLTLAPTAEWNGSPEFEFTIWGAADASYRPYNDTDRSVGGHAVFLIDALIAEKSSIHQYTNLSITEAELGSGTACVQDMLFSMRVLESIGLEVKKTHEDLY